MSTSACSVSVCGSRSTRWVGFRFFRILAAWCTVDTSASFGAGGFWEEFHSPLVSGTHVRYLFPEEYRHLDLSGRRLHEWFLCSVCLVRQRVHIMLQSRCLRTVSTCASCLAVACWVFASRSTRDMGRAGDDFRYAAWFKMDTLTCVSLTDVGILHTLSS